MSYQQGVQSIGSATDTVSVVFTAAYTSTPELVLAVVENTTDTTPLQLLVTVTAKSNTGFTATLSGSTDSANYKLVWMAGTASLLYKVVSAIGLNVSGAPYINGTTDTESYFVMVDMSGTPTVARMKWGVLKTLFASFITTPPSAPTTAGGLGDWSCDASYMYLHDGTMWGRFPRATSNWDIDAPVELVQEGTLVLTQDSRLASVVFETAFGAPPLITFSFENASVGTKQILTGLITGRTVAGFTVTMNTTPDTEDYVMHWRATGTLP